MNRLSLSILIAILTIMALAPVASGQFNEPDSTKRLTSRFAMTFGTPSGVNIAFSHWSTSGYGLRLTVGALPLFPFGYLDGAQAELLYRIRERGSTLIDLSLGAGAVEAHSINMNDGNWLSDDSYESWSYVGLFATMNTHGFFLQSGVSLGSEDTRSVIMVLQVGFSLHSWHSHQ